MGRGCEADNLGGGERDRSAVKGEFGIQFLKMQ